MDLSNGYENIASEFISVRNKSLGVTVIREWSSSLGTSAKVLDIGCGDGIPVTGTIIEAGHTVFAIDASTSMVNAFKENFPGVPVKCEAVEHSDFFGQEYDGVVAVGVIFLLEKSKQLAMIRKVSEILRPGGQFIFSAPTQAGKWDDILTGEESISLGKDQYVEALASSGLEFLRTVSDGSNNYYTAEKQRK